MEPLHVLPLPRNQILLWSAIPYCARDRIAYARPTWIAEATSLMLKADLLLSIRRAGEHFLDVDNRRFRRICSMHITDTRRPS